MHKNHKIFRILVRLSFVILLCGCSAVPLSSMLKMATMGESDITSIQARQVRSRITLDAPAKLQTKDVKLALKFEFAGEETGEYLFVLNLLNTKTLDKKESWFSDGVVRHQYEFELSEESQAEFKKYQYEFIKYGKPKKYYWTVYYYLANQLTDNSHLNMDLELKLAEFEDYFYLLKDAAVDVDD